LYGPLYPSEEIQEIIQEVKEVKQYAR